MEFLPLSLSQMDMWTEQLTWPDSAHLNIGGFSKLDGSIDHDVLRKALHELVNRNIALQLVVDNSGQQHVASSVMPELRFESFTHVEDPEQAAKDWQQDWMQELFATDKPPVRFALLTISENVSFVILQCSHVVMDGWSVSQTIRKWSELYNAILSDTLSEIPAEKSYQEYIDDSLKYRNGRAFQKDLAFWQEQLPSAPELLFDKKYASNNDQQVSQGYLDTCAVSRTFIEQMTQFAKQNECTVLHGLLAVLSTYLAKAYQKDSFVIGLPVLNRSGGKYKNTLGMFVGVMPLEVNISVDDTAKSLMRQISKKLTQAYRYSKFPLSEQFKRLKLIEQNRERLFDVLFSYENFNFDCCFGDAKIIDTRQTFSRLTRYPLALSLGEFLPTEDAEMVIEGKQEYFSRSETKLIGQRFLFVGQQVLQSPERYIKSFNIVPQSEFQQIMLHQPDITTTSIHTVFDNIFLAAKQTPDCPAVLWQQESISFAELTECAVGLSHELLNAGVRRGDIVALCLNKGPEVLVAMLAVARLGAAFLPVDTNTPIARFNNIAERAGVKHVCVSSDNSRFNHLALNLHYLNIERLLELRQPFNIDELDIEVDDIAYVIFTSGSTGQPKGVAVSYRALTLRMNWICNEWQITSNDRALQSTQINFDPALIELLAPLSQGGSVAFPPSSRVLPEQFPEYIEQFQATLMAFVPSTIRRFLAGLDSNKKTSLRVCCSGGEVLEPELAAEFVTKTQTELYNVYGPTEATIFASAWRVPENSVSYKALPIGKLLPDTTAFILDEQQEVLPFGVKGELYLGGPTLSQGYLANDELNRQQFIVKPELSDTPLYKTGDVAWLDCEGFLHFCERNDRQIKLRGYRIELAEIESVLNKMAVIKVAAAKLVTQQENAQIHVWVQPNNSSLDASEVRTYLAAQLPDYMLPSQIFIIEHMPYSGTEKIDYAQLTAVELQTTNTSMRQPIGFIEKALVRVWLDILSAPNINVYDNFFDLGGDSLSAVIMLTRVEQKFSVRLPLHQLIDNPTIHHLAECLERELKFPATVLKLSEQSHNQALFIAASGNGDVLRFKALASELNGVCDLYMLQPPGNELAEDIQQLAELYADKIKSKQLDTIYIAGFSVGGIAAVETARILKNNGVNVKELFIVDTILVKAPWLVIAIWRFFNKMIKQHPNMSTRVLPTKFRAVMSDNGLLMQVQAMKKHKINGYIGDASLLKSSAYRWVQNWFVGKWRKIIAGNLHEFQIKTSHSHFFEPEKVGKLSEVLTNRIVRTSTKDKEC